MKPELEHIDTLRVREPKLQHVDTLERFAKIRCWAFKSSSGEFVARCGNHATECVRGVFLCRMHANKRRVVFRRWVNNMQSDYPYNPLRWIKHVEYK